MVEHHNVVAGDAQVKLNFVNQVLGGFAKAGKGIFRSQAFGTAVADNNHLSSVQ